jgi:hypothetical protein
MRPFLVKVMDKFSGSSSQRLELPWFLHEGVYDTRLWRVAHHYAAQARNCLDLSEVQAVALDEAASKRRHNYLTVFIDLEQKKNR